MKKEMSFSLIVFLAVFIALPGVLINKPLFAQTDEEELEDGESGDEFEDEDDDDEEAERERLRRAAAERKKKAREARLLKERKQAEMQKRELDAQREARAETTEYTIEPSSVQMAVELDPAGYGMMQHNHRMVLSADGDFLLRGRAMLGYDYRFFEFFSIAFKLGIDSTKASLVNSIRKNSSTKAEPEQFAILGGVSSKWRVTEWYMRTAVFIEPSLLVGYMWQTLAGDDTNHFLLRPGLFAGTETVFDTGFVWSWRVGAEFPIDLGENNVNRELVTPLLLVGFGFAI